MFLLSCKKDSTPHFAVRSSEYFPNSTGDKWIYKLVDSIANKSVLVEINITGDKILPDGQQAKIWTYRFPDHIDTNFVYQTGDTVKFLRVDFTLNKIYIVPFLLNSKWKASTGYMYDSIDVNDNRDYYLNQQKFANSFLLNEREYLPNDYWNWSIWFCPNIGMVTMNEKEVYTISNEFTNICWELISFDLK